MQCCKLYVLYLLFMVCLFKSVNCLIIPEELSSLLSVVYSNIPVIKKGTDSRVGFGFAFGNHADAQVVLELGPQTETGKIGAPFSAATSGSSKREVQNLDESKYYGKHTDPKKYLQAWSDSMKNKPLKSIRPQNPGTEVPNLEDSLVELHRNEKGEYEIKQPPPQHIPAQVLMQLKRLYGPDELEKFRTPEQVKKITEDLSNVDLD